MLAYLDLHPVDRPDWERAAMICTTVAQVGGAKNVKLEQFMPSTEPPVREEAEVFDLFKSLTPPEKLPEKHRGR